MKLLIDNREPNNIVKYISALNNMATNKIDIEQKNLELGDFIFYDEINEKNVLIIERKSLSDRVIYKMVDIMNNLLDKTRNHILI